MTTYAFQDINCSMAGPTGFLSLGYGSANSEEGITIEMAGDKNTMTIGADGEGMHSLHADKSGTVIVRLLQTSPQNAKLQAMYDAQTFSSSLHGQNIFVITNSRSGDVTTARSAAFKKKPSLTYAKDGKMREWVFDSLKIDTVLGTY